jgi:hypothetical protein
LTARLTNTERSSINPEQGHFDCSEQAAVALPQPSLFGCILCLG